MTDATASTDVAASGADDIRSDADDLRSDDTGGDPVDSRVAADERGPAAHGSLDEGHLFQLLRSERRRLALRYLLATDGEPVGMRELAAAVAAAENGTSVEALSDEARQRASVPLSQSHLPQLDRAGVVEYDRQRGVVAATPLVAAFEPYLDPDPAAGDAGAGVRLAPVAAGAGVGGLFSLALVWTLGPTGAVLAAVLSLAVLFGVALALWR